MSDNEEMVQRSVTLKVLGQPLRFDLELPAQPVKVRRMLPVFQQMSSSLAGISAGIVEEAGMEITCKAGCGACCRQLVPLAIPEAHSISELVSSMPEERQKVIRERFEKAYRELEESGWIKRFNKAFLEVVPLEEREKVVLEYFAMGIPCPFLEDESCSIHPDRPMACREYLVRSPAKYCAELHKGRVQGVILPLKPSRTVGRMTIESESYPPVDFVPLILALLWAKRFEEDGSEKSGEEWIGDFFSNLTDEQFPGF